MSNRSVLSHSADRSEELAEKQARCAGAGVTAAPIVNDPDSDRCSKHTTRTATRGATETTLLVNKNIKEITSLS